ncbi:hypothetical protein Tco_1133116 [Tanacetum coccineum]|uniref:Uncharacterized protein n=1 Tax=Tanacetum coccineum TaxID=301880 RepID=A0ABQ5JFA9_9ASTR
MQISDSLTQRLRAYSAAPLERIQLRPEFANLSQFPTPETTREFSDQRFYDQPSVLLRKLTIDEITTWVHYIVPMLTSGFNKCGAAAIFQLVYNLKYGSAGTLGDVFDESDVENQPSNFTPTSFGEIIIVTSLHGVGILIRLMLTLNCTSTLLLFALHSPEYARQLYGIDEMLKISNINP